MYKCSFFSARVDVGDTDSDGSGKNGDYDGYINDSDSVCNGSINDDANDRE